MAKQVQKSTGLVHIYSTLANPQKFVAYEVVSPDQAQEMGRLPLPTVEVLIRGGAGIASKNLITPNGVHTAITSEEYDAIKDLYTFKQFVERGFIRVEGKQFDIDKIVGDMNAKDPGGPVTPSDYVNEAQDGSVPVPVELDKAGTGWATQFAR